MFELPYKRWLIFADNYWDPSTFEEITDKYKTPNPLTEDLKLPLETKLQLNTTKIKPVKLTENDALIVENAGISKLFQQPDCIEIKQCLNIIQDLPFRGRLEVLSMMFNDDDLLAFLESINTPIAKKTLKVYKHLFWDVSKMDMTSWQLVLSDYLIANDKWLKMVLNGYPPLTVLWHMGYTSKTSIDQKVDLLLDAGMAKGLEMAVIGGPGASTGLAALTATMFKIEEQRTSGDDTLAAILNQNASQKILYNEPNYKKLPASKKE